MFRLKICDESKITLYKKKKTKTNAEIQRTDWWLPEGKGVGREGEMGEGNQLYGDGGTRLLMVSTV